MSTEVQTGSSSRARTAAEHHQVMERAEQASRTIGVGIHMTGWAARSRGLRSFVVIGGVALPFSRS
jgi:hypothetical protein